MQSVSHYHTPSRELMDHTHSTVLLFEYGDYLCNVIFSLCFSCLPPGLALEDVLLFPSLFTFFSFLSLILRTDLVVETSTRWEYQIRPPGDRTPRRRRSHPGTGPDPPPQPRLSERDPEPDSRPLSVSQFAQSQVRTRDPRVENALYWPLYYRDKS